MEGPEEICHSDTVYGKASMGNVDMKSAHDKDTKQQGGKEYTFFQRTNLGQDGKIFNLIYIIYWKPVSLFSPWRTGPT